MVHKLTDKQKVALTEALEKGQIFQSPLCKPHSYGVLAALVKRGYLVRLTNDFFWEITVLGREALSAQPATSN